MHFFLWHRWAHPFWSRHSRTGRSFRNHTRLNLERCEDRTLPSTFTVTNLGDEGSGAARPTQALAGKPRT
jgi:hypothetical protein